MDSNQWTVDQRTCDYCGQQGHVRKRCRELNPKRSDEESFVVPDNLSERLDNLKEISCELDNNEPSDSVLECMDVSSIDNFSSPCLLNVSIENNLTKLEIDSGFRTAAPNFNQTLSKRFNKLFEINSSRVTISGQHDVTVELNRTKAIFNLLMLDCYYHFIPLLGRTRLNEFFPNWRFYFGISLPGNNIRQKQHKTPTGDIKIKCADVFVRNSSNSITNCEADVILKSNLPISKQDNDFPYDMRQNNFKIFVFNFKIPNIFSSKSLFASFISQLVLNVSVPIQCNKFVKSNIITDDSLAISIETINDIFQKNRIYFTRYLWPKKTDKHGFKMLRTKPDFYDLDVCLLFQDKVNITQKFQGEMIKLERVIHEVIHDGIIDMIKFVEQAVHLFGFDTNFVAVCGVCSNMAIIPKHNINSKFSNSVPTKKPSVGNDFSKRVEVKRMIKIDNYLVVIAKLVMHFASFLLDNVTMYDNGFLHKSCKLYLENQISLRLSFNDTTMVGNFPPEKYYTHTSKMLICLIKTKKHNKPHIRGKWIKASFLKRFSQNVLQIMVGNEATTTSHPNQIRVLEDGHGVTGLSKRVMRVVETGRPLSTVEITENGRPLRTAAERMMEPVLNESDIWQLPGHSNGSASNQRKLMKNKNRKRKFPSEPSESPFLLKGEELMYTVN
ncbi:uncharacterized protein LOC134213337 [Armigeres subalbatus]|uniref:uncharacterized protein LOC134213337 n=1 Tax=Armigeres subalbatus TaxID=124917 RepID=UPI002ED38280